MASSLNQLEKSLDKVREILSNQESRIQKLYNLLWVIGIIAGVFGISAGFGWTLLSNANEKIANLKLRIDSTEQLLNQQDKRFATIRENNEKEFQKYIDSNKKTFINTVDESILKEAKREIIKIHDRINNIKLKSGNETYISFKSIDGTAHYPDEPFKFVTGYRDEKHNNNGLNTAWFRTLTLEIPRTQ